VLLRAGETTSALDGIPVVQHHHEDGSCDASREMTPTTSRLRAD
jgi:hypothetical protein